MSDRQAPWRNTVGTGESFTLKVERAARPPLPWTWEIVSAGGKAGTQRSLRATRSAEEAWFKTCHFQVTPEIDRALMVKGFLVLGVTPI